MHEKNKDFNLKQKKKYKNVKLCFGFILLVEPWDQMGLFVSKVENFVGSVLVAVIIFK